ncbi:MAG: hypothetical protein ABJK32_00310, partial [Nitratireductor sp.]
MAEEFEPALLRAQAFDGEKLAEGIVDWVEMETPSDRPDLIDRMLDRVESAFDGLPVEIRRLPARD